MYVVGGITYMARIWWCLTEVRFVPILTRWCLWRRQRSSSSSGSDRIAPALGEPGLSLCAPKAVPSWGWGWEQSVICLVLHVHSRLCAGESPGPAACSVDGQRVFSARCLAGLPKNPPQGRKLSLLSSQHDARLLFCPLSWPVWDNVLSFLKSCPNNQNKLCLLVEVLVQSVSSLIQKMLLHLWLCSNSFVLWYNI